MRQPSNSQMQKPEDDLFSYHFSQPGTIPGTIRVKPDAAQSEIALIDYNANQAVRLTHLTLEDCAAYLDTESVSWVDVSGLGSQEVLQQLRKIFQLHPLVLEDIINVPQRPKVEDYEDRLLIITQMVVLKEEGEGFWLEQVSLVLGQHYLLTVQEEPTRDTFEPVRDRIRNNRGTIRQRGVDYLAYALWDTIIDGYFLALEAYGERLEALENEVAIRPTKQTLTKIYQIRRELLALRRAIWPQRDAINTIIRDECSLVSKDVRIYLRDCYDHAVQIIDVIETYRELASGLMDVYLSAVGNKMNEVMKLLTVISTIFIPLTFVAGIYGMNFNPDVSPFNMPELNWYWGYPLFWAVTIAIAFSLSFFFWRRGWFSDTSTLKPH
ncbi:MAG: magnesium/cobalt transporter CorA [Hydrococcus sp. CRU_1_1]|jgi:magnesium transporter|nr:magnesium/cobalt transporter CorA [Hydrococcus sp. CRU_1_1]